MRGDGYESRLVLLLSVVGVLVVATILCAVLIAAHGQEPTPPTTLNLYVFMPANVSDIHSHREVGTGDECWNDAKEFLDGAPKSPAFKDAKALLVSCLVPLGPRT